MAAETLLEPLLQGQLALWRSPEATSAAWGCASGPGKGGQEPRCSDISPWCPAPTAAGAAAPSAAQQVQGPPAPQAQHPLTLVQLRQGEEILVVRF